MSTIEASAHSYPRELAEQIWSLWNSSDGSGTALDSVETLNSFLSVAYQASLLREEGRPVECRITLSELKNLEPAGLAAIGFHLVRFSRRRSFAEQEIRRLGAHPKPDKEIENVYVKHERLESGEQGVLEEVSTNQFDGSVYDKQQHAPRQRAED